MFVVERKPCSICRKMNSKLRTVSSVDFKIYVIAHLSKHKKIKL